MEHEIYIEAEVASSPELEERLKQAVLAALEAEGVDVPCIIEVCLTDDEGIHQTNLDMRGVDAPTDVLSFPMFELTPGEKPQAEWADPDSGCVPLGDMVLSLERVEAQAQEYGHSVRRVFAFLIAHSMLHLLGYDHMEEEERRLMEDRQRKIMEKAGILR